MKTTLLLIALVLGMLAYVRLAPSDPERWHIDPATARNPGPGGVLRQHSLDLPPAEALQAFDAIALTEQRIKLLAGAPDKGRVTYVVRSQWAGFPDYITVAATPSETGSTLHILSRLRFGMSDMGVNAARLDRWLKALEAAQN